MASSSRRTRPTEYDDGRSNVSSFYGQRRSTYDAVAGGEGEGPAVDPVSLRAGRERRDSASTFFGRNVDEYGPETRHDDYNNRNSFFAQAPRTEPVKGLGNEEVDATPGSAWDVFADFNNAGPRYSGANNLTSAALDHKGYRALSTPGDSKADPDESEPVEMVTVPKFGPEWSKAELKSMTRQGKDEEKAFARAEKWKEWRHDKRGVCGISWLTRKVLVWSFFFLIILVAVSLAILLPRVPSFGFNDANPVQSNGGTPLFLRAPEANFTFNAKLDLEINTGGNIIPIHINNLHAKMYSIDDNKLIAEGNSGGMTFKGGSRKAFELPIVFSYAAANDTDTTWLLVYNACKNKSQFQNAQRPGLNLNLILSMNIRGLVTKSGASTALSNVACPIELPNSAA